MCLWCTLGIGLEQHSLGNWDLLLFLGWMIETFERKLFFDNNSWDESVIASVSTK